MHQSVSPQNLRYNNNTMPDARRPKLGQHFLADNRTSRRIVEALDIHRDELVIEIGAGRGAMTGLLAERARRVVAIELDGLLTSQLNEKFGSDPRIEVVHADILSTDLARLCRRWNAEKSFVFGNLPYYITAPILNHLAIYRARVRAMALVLQHEVAERLTAVPGTRDYGYLTVLVQLVSEPEILLRIPPGAFSPAPKVNSALVYFKIRPMFLDWQEEDHESFLQFAKRCFAQKRKNLPNNLSTAYLRRRVLQELDRLSFAPTLRAEQLTIEQLARLFQGLR
jgi:16S rRNA (adenine1518-N6/adenine1519-N6)-dimethyltransferase